MNVFIFGYFGWNNVGDDAIGCGLIKGINDLKQDAKFYVPSKREYFFENLEDLDIKRLKFSFLDILKGILRSEHVIIAGGTHFYDEGDDEFHRLKIFILFGLMISLARFLRKKVSLIGHGIGPLSKGWSITLSRYIFNRCSNIYVRDRLSKTVLNNLGYKHKSNLAFDAAVLLFGYEDFLVSHNKSNRQNLGISLLPFFEIYQDDEEKDKLNVENLGIVLNSILNDNDNIDINLFSFRGGNLHSDTPILKELYKKLPSNRVNIIEYEGDLASFVQKISKCDFFICTRYHSAIFAYMLDIPSLIISYMEKCEGFSRYVSFPERVTISLKELSKPDILFKLKALIEEPNKYRAKLERRKAMFKAKKMLKGVL